MRIRFSRSMLTAAALLAMPALQAQQPAEELPAPPGGQAEEAPIEVTEADMDTFATIYVELQETVVKYEEEMAAVQDEEEAQVVQTRMQQESIETLEKHGWTPDRFNRVAQALNRDPALTERTLELIKEKS